LNTERTFSGREQSEKIHKNLIIIFMFIDCLISKINTFSQGPEPVLRTLKNPRFCRVLGTGSGKNPKFEWFQNRFLGTTHLLKRVPEPVPWNSKF
jgi:hypothetical protein